MLVIGADALADFVIQLLVRSSFTEADAKDISDQLIWANLRGIDSHGVLRVPSYIQALKAGLINSRHNIRESKRAGSICVLDGDGAPGAAAMNRATETAREMSDKFGLGWCSIGKIGHAGAIGYFVEKLAGSGKVGIAMTASKPLMAYHGAKGAALSSNPIAFGVPSTGSNLPLVFDMATSAVSLGKIMAARDADQPIPMGWALDSDGKETTDPLRAEVVLPMAGAKGSGLSLMSEVLCSLLIGRSIIAPALAGANFTGLNGMVLAIDPAFFGKKTDFLAEVTRIVGAIRSLDPVTGTPRVLLPGDRSREVQRFRTSTGIPLPDGTIARLAGAAIEVGLPVPSAFGDMPLSP